MKVQKSKLIKIIRDRRQMKLRSNTHGCELIIKTVTDFKTYNTTKRTDINMHIYSSSVVNKRNGNVYNEHSTFTFFFPIVTEIYII